MIAPAPKVTGAALYAADMALPDVAHAYHALEPHREGAHQITFDLNAARACPACSTFSPTKRSAATSARSNTRLGAIPASNSVDALGSAEVAYAGQPIAMVLAETLEVAQDAASQIGVEYEEQPSAGKRFGPKGALIRSLR